MFSQMRCFPLVSQPRMYSSLPIPETQSIAEDGCRRSSWQALDFSLKAARHILLSPRHAVYAEEGEKRGRATGHCAEMVVRPWTREEGSDCANGRLSPLRYRACTT